MVKRFEWDPTKARATKLRRNVAFEDAAKMFAREGRMVVSRDKRHAREYRYRGLGFVNNVLHHVIFVLRNGFIRIVQMRKASKNERKAYKQQEAAHHAGHKRSATAPRPFYR